MTFNSERSRWWMGLGVAMLVGALVGIYVARHLSISWVWAEK